MISKLSTSQLELDFSVFLNINAIRVAQPQANHDPGDSAGDEVESNDSTGFADLAASVLIQAIRDVITGRKDAADAHSFIFSSACQNQCELWCGIAGIELDTYRVYAKKAIGKSNEAEKSGKAAVRTMRFH